MAALNSSLLEKFESLLDTYAPLKNLPIQIKVSRQALDNFWFIQIYFYTGSFKKGGLNKIQKIWKSFIDFAKKK